MVIAIIIIIIKCHYHYDNTNNDTNDGDNDDLKSILFCPSLHLHVMLGVSFIFHLIPDELP